jgi:hypothetical protein
MFIIAPAERKAIRFAGEDGIVPRSIPEYKIKSLRRAVCRGAAKKETRDEEKP